MGPTSGAPKPNSVEKPKSNESSQSLPPSKIHCNKKYFNNLKIWYTNADTLTPSKLSELESNIKASHPDIICITEVNPKNSKDDICDEAYNIEGYSMTKSNAGRGIIIYAALHLLASQVDTSTPYESSLWTNIKITNNHNIIIGTIYRSPNSNGENNNKLLDLLQEVTKLKHDHIIINGDFNLKQIDWESNHVSGISDSYQNRVFDCVNDLFLTEVIKEPTRFRGTNTPSNLDWVLTENPECIQEKSVESPLGLSDHSMISVTYQCNVEKDESDETNRYSFFNGNYSDMRDDFNNISWDQELNNRNTQDSWDIIHGKLTGLIERHVPKKKFTNSKSPPWYGREIGNLSNQKKKYWHKYKKNPCHATWIEYTQRRNKLSHTIERLKTEYENKIAAESKQNPKKFWKYISSKTKSKGKISVLKDPNNAETSDDFEKAELLNNHFASVFTKEDLTNVPDFTLEVDDIIIMDQLELTDDGIKEYLLKLDPNKSSGPDGINGRVLKELATEISPILKTLYSRSLEEGTLPYQWREAHVIALFKKGSRRSPNNYRPVSLTSICCKILEKIIRNVMVKNLENQGLIHKDQHGFTGGRSCCTQLLEVMEMWTRWFDLGLPWDVIYTDFSKAFDSVPHERLLKKVEAYGIQGDLLRWIRSFLSSRKQRVILGGKLSNWQDVTSGIPQGSVLGPILFTIFINDMPDVVESCMKLFADDAKIYKAIESFHDTSIIQNDINKLLNWSNIWQLPLNLDKCKGIHYGKKNPGHSYTIGNKNLIIDSEEKDVGVLFDNTLDFRSHMKKMISKANQRVGLIKRSFSRLNKNSFKILYKSLVRPLLEYCSVIWFPLYKTEALEIEKVQRRATKLIPSLKKNTYAERLKALNLTTLAYRRERTDMLQVFRIIRKIDRIPFDYFFKYNTSTTRGHDYHLEKPRAMTSLRQNSFSHRVINLWNVLPSTTVNCLEINDFKTELESAWKNREIKYKFGEE